MPVPVVFASGYFGAGTYAASASASVDVGSNAHPMLVIFCAVDDGAPANVTATAATYKGVSMLPVGAAVRRYGTTSNGLYQAFYLAGAAALGAGAGGLAATFNSNARQPIVGWAVIHDANAASPLTAEASSAQSGANQSVSVASNADAIALALVITDQSGAPTTPTGGTVNRHSSLIGNLRFEVWEKGGAPTSTITATQGTGNASARLVFSANAAVPLGFSGPVPAKAGSVGDAFAWGVPALGSYFSGGTAPYAYAVLSGPLPSGLVLDGVTGVISGTPAAAAAPSIVIRVTDAAAATVDTNAFTITVSADATPPTLSGAITVSALTPTSYTLAWPAGADNVAVTGYDYSLDGGAIWTALGNVLTFGIAGRTPSTTDQVRVRATDAAGNLSTPVLSTSVTLPAAADVTPPTLGGAITVSGLSSTGYNATCPVAADDEAVTGYQYRINAGTWTTIGAAGRTAAITGRTPSTVDALEMRAFDAASNFSLPLSTNVNLPAAATYAFSAGPGYLNTGSGPQVNSSVTWSLWYGGQIGALAGITPLEGAGVTHITTGVLAVSGLSQSGAALLMWRDAAGGIYYEQVAVA